MVYINICRGSLLPVVCDLLLNLELYRNNLWLPTLACVPDKGPPANCCGSSKIKALSIPNSDLRYASAT